MNGALSGGQFQKLMVVWILTGKRQDDAGDMDIASKYTGNVESRHQTVDKWCKLQVAVEGYLGFLLDVYCHVSLHHSYTIDRGTLPSDKACVYPFG